MFATGFDGKATTVDKTSKVNTVVDTKLGPIQIKDGGMTSSTLGSSLPPATPPM